MTEAPLAKINEEWNEFSEINSKNNQKESNLVNNFFSDLRTKDEILNLKNSHLSNNENNLDLNKNFLQVKLIEEEEDEFEQIIKVESLEDLVNTFDEKIIKCFVNYDEPIENIKPVKILNHEDLINECQMWWTLTGNFGQILPIDWKSTYAIKLLLPYLTGNNQSPVTNANETTDNKRACRNARNNCESSLAKDSIFVNNLSSSCKFNDTRKKHLNSSFLNEDIYLGDNLSNEQDLSANYEFDSDSSEDDDEFILNTLSYDYSSHNLARLNDTGETLAINNQPIYYKTHFEDEDEEQLAKDLDFHCLILCSNNELQNTNVHETNGIKRDQDDSNLLFTAEQVLQEIDIFLQEDNDDIEGEQNSTFNTSLESSTYQPSVTDLLYDNVKTMSLANLTCKQLDKPNSVTTSYSSNSLDDVLSANQTLSSSLTSNNLVGASSKQNDNKSLNNSIICSTIEESYEQHLNNLNITQLNEVYLELERMIQHYSEILIQELALRDELEFEKELKNTFISLLLSIQNKRRKQILHKKNNPKSPDIGSKYLTTIIPYNSENGPPDVRTLQILIKILKAINEDSPTVPTLLTDFILKVLCPTQ